MNGYFARVTGCCGTTRVDLGVYSVIDICRWLKADVARAAAIPSIIRKVLGIDGLFLYQRYNLMPQFFGKMRSIVQSSLSGGNGVADAHGHLTASDVSGAIRQHFPSADESDGDERDAGADGNIGRAFHEGAHLAFSRSAALGKDEQ